MMPVENCRKSQGILIDFDLASLLDGNETNSIPTLNIRIGNAKYIAFDLMVDDAAVTHANRHDIEAFFYILLWITGGYEFFSRNDKCGNVWNNMSYDKGFLFSSRKHYITKFLGQMKEKYRGLKKLIALFFAELVCAFAAGSVASCANVTNWETVDIDSMESLREEVLADKISWANIKYIFD